LGCLEDRGERGQDLLIIAAHAAGANGVPPQSAFSINR
jgi:hypothetical protein